MISLIVTCVHKIYLYHPYRAEKERSQYFGEVNDLRHSLDTLANEKVLSCEKIISKNSLLLAY